MTGIFMKLIRYLILIVFLLLNNTYFAQEESKTETPPTPVSEPDPQPVVTPDSQPKTETPINPDPVSPNPAHGLRRQYLRLDQRTH